MTFLHLEYNQFTGPIPSEISNLSNLVWLNFVHNQLTGEIPESICDLNMNWSDPNNFNISEKVNLLLGASYLHGSAYCQGFPVTHFSPCQDNNPAYTYYGTLTVNDRLILKGGFAKTSDVWDGTFNPTPPLNVFEAAKVSSLDFGAKYDLNQSDKVRYTISGEFSNFRAGAEGSPWERQSQIVLGLAALMNKSAKLFVEVFRTEGFAPLNFISGSADFQPFAPGTTHSVADANSIGIVVGAQISF